MKEKLQRMEAKLDRWGEALDQKWIRYPSDLVTGILFLVLQSVSLLGARAISLPCLISLALS